MSLRGKGVRVPVDGYSYLSTRKGGKGNIWIGLFIISGKGDWLGVRTRLCFYLCVRLLPQELLEMTEAIREATHQSSISINGLRPNIPARTLVAGQGGSSNNNLPSYHTKTERHTSHSNNNNFPRIKGGAHMIHAVLYRTRSNSFILALPRALPTLRPSNVSLGTPDDGMKLKREHV